MRATGTGRPVGGARVLGFDVAREVVSGETAVDGIARLELPVAPFRLGVRAEGYLDWNEVISVDDDNPSRFMA